MKPPFIDVAGVAPQVCFSFGYQLMTIVHLTPSAEGCETGEQSNLHGRCLYVKREKCLKRKAASSLSNTIGAVEFCYAPTLDGDDRPSFAQRVFLNFDAKPLRSLQLPHPNALVRVRAARPSKLSFCGTVIRDSYHPFFHPIRICPRPSYPFLLSCATLFPCIVLRRHTRTRILPSCVVKILKIFCKADHSLYHCVFLILSDYSSYTLGLYTCQKTFPSSPPVDHPPIHLHHSVKKIFSRRSSHLLPL